MKATVLVAAALGFCGLAFGQSVTASGQHLNPIGQGHLPSGQGSVLHPGIPMSGPPPARPRVNSSAARGGVVYVPYGVPIDPYGYGGGYGYGNPYYDPDAPLPSVLVNPNYQPEVAHPVLNDYSNVPLPQPGPAYDLSRQPSNVQRLDQGSSPAQDLARTQEFGQTSIRPQPPRDDQPTIFLIAMKDGTIYPAIAYWVDKNTLNYVTLDTVVKRVPLDQVDRDLSRTLNDQRNVEFKLPSP